MKLTSAQKTQNYIAEREHQIRAALKVLQEFTALRVHENLALDLLPSLRKPLFDLHHAALKALSEVNKLHWAKYSPPRFEDDK